MEDNKVPVDLPCPLCKTRPCFMWWPWTVEGLRHEGPSMVACNQCFHQLWAGEGD